MIISVRQLSARVARSPLFWLVLATAILYQLALVPYWKPTWDSATYISLAQAMVQGDGYSYMGYPHTKYPPGFPLLLAPIEMLFGHCYWLMRLVVVSCAVGSVGVSYLLLRPRSGRLVALGCATATAASYALLSESTHILSDIPYMLASLGALWAGERYLQRIDRRSLVLVMIMILVSTSIRLLGAVLALAVAAAVLSNPPSRSRRTLLEHALLLVGVVALFVSAWVGRGALVQRHLPSELRESVGYEREFVLENPNNPGSPIIQWNTLVNRVRLNTIHYEHLLGKLLTGGHAQRRMRVHLFALLVMAGLGITWFRKRGVLEYYLLLYLWILLLWPSRQGERFLVPVLPLLFFYPIQTLRALFAQLNHAGRRPGPRGAGLGSRIGGGLVRPRLGRALSFAQWAVWGTLAVAYVALSGPAVWSVIQEERREPYYRGETGDYIQTINWVRDNTDPDAVIITDRAPWAYLLSGRTSFTSPWVHSTTEVLSSLDRNGATHIIANDWGYSGIFLKPVIEAHPERFVEAHRIGGQIVYTYQRSSLESPTPPTPPPDDLQDPENVTST